MVLSFRKELWSQHPSRILQELVAHSAIYTLKREVEDIFMIPGRYANCSACTKVALMVML
jgi:hypothetical protein